MRLVATTLLAGVGRHGSPKVQIRAPVSCFSGPDRTSHASQDNCPANPTPVALVEELALSPVKGEAQSPARTPSLASSAAKRPDFSTFLVGAEGLEPPTPSL